MILTVLEKQVNGATSAFIYSSVTNPLAVELQLQLEMDAFQPELVNNVQFIFRKNQQTQGHLLVGFSTVFHGQLFARGLTHSFVILHHLGEYFSLLSIDHDLFLDIVYDHMAQMVRSFNINAVTTGCISVCQPRAVLSSHADLLRSRFIRFSSPIVSPPRFPNFFKGLVIVARFFLFTHRSPPGYREAQPIHFLFFHRWRFSFRENQPFLFSHRYFPKGSAPHRLRDGRLRVPHFG